MSKQDPSKNPPSENAFSGDYISHADLYPNDIPITPQSEKNPFTESTRITLASLIWFAATVGTSVVSEGGFNAFMKELGLNPGGFVRGSLWTIPYNVAIASGATEAHKKILGKDHSPANTLLAAAGGAATEAVLGNPFDIASLGEHFHAIKLRTALTQNPDIINQFSTEELRKLLPKCPENLPRDQLLETAKNGNYSDIAFNRKNLEMLASKTNVKFTPHDFAKINGLILIPSILRNLPPYFTMGMAHQSSQNGEGIDLESSAAISLAGAVATLIPNTAIYQAGNNFMKGMEALESLKSAFKDSTRSIVGDPSKIGILLAIRTAALFSTSLIFTPQFEETLNSVSKTIAATILGIKESLDPKTEKKIDATVIEIINNPDPKTIEQATKRYEEILRAETSSLNEKPNTTTASPATQKLHVDENSKSSRSH